MRDTTWIAAAVALALAAPAWGAADLAVRVRTTVTGEAPKTFEAMEYHTDTRTITDGARQRTIVDLTAKTVTMVDKKSASYTVTTFDILRKQGEALRQRAPAARASESPAAEPSAKPTGKTERIAGYEAKEYAVAGGPFTGSAWMSEELEQPAGNAEWKKLAASIRLPRPGDAFQKAIATLHGFPLRTVITDTRSPQRNTVTTEAVEVHKQPPPAEVLAAQRGRRVGVLHVEHVAAKLVDEERLGIVDACREPAGLVRDGDVHDAPPPLARRPRRGNARPSCTLVCARVDLARQPA
jgi:hypothetical protein